MELILSFPYLPSYPFFYIYYIETLSKIICCVDLKYGFTI